MERAGKGHISPAENHKLIIGYDRSGVPITLPQLAQIFRSHQDDFNHQVKLARLCITRALREGNAQPDDILTLLSAEPARDEVRIWCKGNNIRLEEEEQETCESGYQRAKRLLTEDEDLIKQLGTHLKQADLARLLAAKHYREADEETRQTLMFGTYRLLGDVLGPRRHYRYGREEQVVTPIHLPDLPEELFSNELTRNILLESEIEAAMPIFQRGREEGFRYLRERREQTESPIIKDFISALEEEYQKGLSLWVPGVRRKIPGSQKDIPDTSEITYSDYPSPHQQFYAYRFCHKPESIGPTDLLVGDPRTMKTGSFIYAMKAIGAKTPLVVCPANLRDTWEREIREKIEEPVEIIRIESEKELRRLAKEGVKKRPDYVILSYSLLSRFSSLEAQGLFESLKDKLDIDALGADEAHLAKESTAECTRQLYLLSRVLPEKAPRIAMSATFVVNSVEDLDEPIRMLLPYRYPNPGDFTWAARNNPYLISALLYGNKLITRWTKEAVLGDKLPRVEGGGPREELVPLSPFHHQIYDFVYHDSTIEDRLKRGMLRQVSLDPLLIRHHYTPGGIQEMIRNLQGEIASEKDERKQEILSEKIRALEERLEKVTQLFTPEEAVKALSEAHNQFIHWKLTQNIDEVFDEDFLVKIGFGKLATWAFFNLLPGGVNELVRRAENPFLSIDWTGLGELYSSKYRHLKTILDKKIAAGDEKIILFSGFYKTNVTTGVEGLEDIHRDEQEAFMSLYDHLRNWYGDETVLKIDGSVSIEPRRGELAAREKVRRLFRLHPPAKILLATSRSARLGQDLSIPPTKANQHFARLVTGYLDLPDTNADLVQGDGRGQGPGQIIPLEIFRLMTTNAEQPETARYGFIDHGIAQALEYKRLIAQMAIDGIPLTKEEEDFVKTYMTNLRIDVYPQTPRSYMRERFFVDIRGKGTKKNLEYLEKVGFEGLTNEDFFVTYYPQNDETSLSGHNAKAVAEIFKRFREFSGKGRLRIGSVGSGAGILQATLGEPLINIDMMQGVLQFARQRLHEKGSFIRADAAHLPIQDNAFDAFDASMILHWTDNSPRSSGAESSERSFILQELNRVTRMNGLVTITVPSTYLTSEQFGRWRASLEKYFGLRVRDDLPSGLLKAIDYRPEPISWILNLEKVGKPQPGFSLRDLRFDFEQVVSIISPARGKGGNGNGISIPQPIPHSEFEIIHPESGRKDGLVYKKTVSYIDIEEELLGKKEKPRFEAEDIISQFGVEEYGFYRRLRKLARSRWNLDQKESDRLALEAISEWARNSTQKHDSQRILTELDIIMEDLIDRRKAA